jgi:hypothetical protein
LRLQSEPNAGKVMTINLTNLKQIKNNVIGNPSAKLALAQDQDFIQM